MISRNIRWGKVRTGERHGSVALVAIIVSLMLHAVVAYCIADVRFDVLTEDSYDKTSRSKRAMTASRREKLETQGTKRPSVLSASDAAFAVDVFREVELLKIAPDEALIQPPDISSENMVGSDGSLIKEKNIPKREEWKAYREILAIEESIAKHQLREVSKKRVPRMDRVIKVPSDLVKIDRPKALLRTKPPVKMAMPEVDIEKLTEIAIAAASSPELKSFKSTSREGIVSEIFDEKDHEISTLKALDNLLKANMVVYEYRKDKEYGYFRVEVKRAGSKLLPAIPKDIVLIQDSSASMAEQRLHFCRTGLLKCLSRIGPKDRFNIISFSDSSKQCFDNWASTANKDSIAKAQAFINALEPQGSTDILASIKALAKIKRSPGRPLIAILITDGYSNTGMTKSSNIIGEFSNLNNGEMSVFTIGTIDTANTYLLDLLSYCNGGDSKIVDSGRWDIPAVMESKLIGAGRPVLANLRFGLLEDSGCEVYGVQSGHLYMDKPLVIYGRYKKGVERFIFQAVGVADKLKCDMLFDLPIADAEQSKDAEIRKEWARQKIYNLIGEYTRKPQLEMLKEIKKTSHNYKVKIPYEGKY